MTGYEFELNFRNESVETLLLMVLFGHESLKNSALREMKDRQAMVSEAEDLFGGPLTNLISIC